MPHAELGVPPQDLLSKFGRGEAGLLRVNRFLSLLREWHQPYGLAEAKAYFDALEVTQFRAGWALRLGKQTIEILRGFAPLIFKHLELFSNFEDGHLIHFPSQALAFEKKMLILLLRSGVILC